MHGNQFTKMKWYKDNDIPVPDEIRQACLAVKKKRRQRSDKGKKHHFAGSGYIPTVAESRARDMLRFEEEQKNLEDTIEEIKKWEEYERTKGEKRRLQKERKILRDKQYRRNKVISIREEGGDPYQLITLQRRFRTLKARLRIIPPNFKCPCCGQIKENSKQWIVDLKNCGCICKVCYCSKRLVVFVERHNHHVPKEE